MTSASRQLARDIKTRNLSGESYRKIAASFPRRADGTQVVKAGTICRMVKEPGWLPKDREILVALGLRKARVLTPMQMAIVKMADETKQEMRSWRKK